VVVLHQLLRAALWCGWIVVVVKGGRVVNVGARHGIAVPWTISLHILGLDVQLHLGEIQTVTFSCVVLGWKNVW
jgi:hypothetical protein